MTDRTDPQRFHTVVSVMSAMDLALVEAELREHGIPFELLDQHTLQVAPHLSTAIGGVRVQVRLQDMDEARRVLLDLGIQPERPHETSELFEEVTEGTDRYLWFGRLPAGQRYLALAAVIVTVFALLWALKF